MLTRFDYAVITILLKLGNHLKMKTYTYTYNELIDFIKSQYKDFINGKYTALDCDNVKGYSYELWCDNSDSINVNSDIIHIMRCDCNIIIPQTKCPTLYISNDSDITIKVNGYNSIRIYLFEERLKDIRKNLETGLTSRLNAIDEKDPAKKTELREQIKYQIKNL